MTVAGNRAIGMVTGECDKYSGDCEFSRGGKLKSMGAWQELGSALT